LYTGIILISALIIAVTVYLSRHFYLHQSAERELAEEGVWENSIAVLPFADLSAKQDQEYFCDGITVQIISNLSQLNDLKVIARTSVMKYKDSNKSIPEIGKELNVANILEGTIRRVDDRLRVTAELVQSTDGYHLWAKDYDREIKDIFAVQDDVSKAIANALLQEITPGEVEGIKVKQTQSSEAYEYYLKGEYFHHKKYYRSIRIEDFKKSEIMFKKAIEIDPNYAAAYAGLADLYNTYSFRIKNDHKYSDLQQDYINLAFKLDSNSTHVNRVKGDVHAYYNENPDAYLSYKRALEINPNASQTITAMGMFLRDCGLHYQSINFFSKAIELNPLDTYQYTRRGVAYRLIGDFDKANIDFQKALEIEHDNSYLLNRYARLLIIVNRLTEAEGLLERAEEISPDYHRNRITRAMLYAAKGNMEDAIRSLEEGGLKNRYNKIVVFSLLGFKDQAIQLIEKKPFADLYNNDDSDYLDMLNNPIFDALRDTEQFKIALQKANDVYQENLNRYREIFWVD
jgi:TolB-like protein/Tfp pilus assembly protein PilF